jgi:hypothetical protein
LHVFGVEQARERDEPTFPEVDEDLAETVSTTYGTADPVVVGAELEHEAERLAEVAEGAWPDRWTRGITIGSTRSDIRRLLEHALHDSVHHLDDVERGLATLRGTPRSD